MTEEELQGCVEPAEGPVVPEAEQEQSVSGTPSASKEVMKMRAMVGKEAPDFGASAYHEGGFKNIKLSDYRGQWVFLCFYPGDYTFV